MEISLGMLVMWTDVIWLVGVLFLNWGFYKLGKRDGIQSEKDRRLMEWVKRQLSE